MVSVKGPAAGCLRAGCAFYAEEVTVRIFAEDVLEDYEEVLSPEAGSLCLLRWVGLVEGMCRSDRRKTCIL